MNRLHQRVAVAVFVCLAAAGSAIVAQEPSLTEDQVRQFLLQGKVVASHQTSKGITSPWRLTLSDGSLTHDAAFQSVDVQKGVMELADGSSEVGFRDFYGFNIAAFELAKLLGLGEMIPLTVERSWKGSPGSLSWWLPVKFDELERQKRKLEPPDANAWNMQLNKMWVFSELVYDTDRNQTNMLIGENWELWMIDFTRAFRSHHKLKTPARLVMCDRQLFEKLRRLDETVVREKTKPYLGKDQVKAIMARRDLIVAYFEKKIAEQGEDAALY